jgi:hypothetical protein
MHHVVAGGTYSAAPVAATDGFHMRNPGGAQNYDALETVFTLTGAGVTDTCDARFWFYVPSHNGGEWVSTKLQEGILAAGNSNDIRSPSVRVNTVPVDATRMYVQIVATTGTITDVYFTVYGISGIVANVSMGDMEVDVEFSGTIGSVKLEDATNSAYKAAVDADGAQSVRDAFGTLIGVLGQNSSYSSPYDFTVAYAAATQLTLTNMTFDPTDVQLVGVAVRDASNDISAVYLSDKYTFSWVANPGVGGTLTVAGATFAATDTGYIVVVVNGPPKASGSGGGGAGGANNLYISPQDFTAVYASGTTLTLAGIPFVPADTQWVSVSQFNSAGEEVQYTPASTGFTYNPATGVLTVAGGAFAGTDLGYRVQVYGPDKAYSTPEDANKQLRLNPDPYHYTPAVVCDLTDITDASTPLYFYLDMASYNHFSLHLILHGGNAGATAGVTVTCEGTVQDDGTVASSCVYEDITNDVFGVASLNAPPNTAVSDVWVDDTGWGGGFRYIRVKVVAVTTGDSGDATIYSRRWYA